MASSTLAAKVELSVATIHCGARACTVAVTPRVAGIVCRNRVAIRDSLLLTTVAAVLNWPTSAPLKDSQVVIDEERDESVLVNDPT